MMDPPGVIVSDGVGLHAAFRARRQELGVAFSVLNQVAGVDLDKLLAPMATYGEPAAHGRRTARGITMDSLCHVLAGLGLTLAVIPDAEAEARIKRHASFRPRKELYVRTQPDACTASIDDVVRHRVRQRLRDWGKVQHWGGLARAAKLSPRRRTEIARKAARARWAKAARK